jgi:hypothetical protein
VLDLRLDPLWRYTTCLAVFCNEGVKIQLDLTTSWLESIGPERFWRIISFTDIALRPEAFVPSHTNSRSGGFAAFAGETNGQKTARPTCLAFLASMRPLLLHPSHIIIASLSIYVAQPARSLLAPTTHTKPSRAISRPRLQVHLVFCVDGHVPATTRRQLYAFSTIPA